MSDCKFDAFVLQAKRGDIDQVRSMLFEIANEIPVECVIQAEDGTLTVTEDFCDKSDLLAELLPKYADRLMDTEPFHGDTENNGDWFWRIRDGKYGKRAQS